ncbi:unnamed protein product [Discosporangium mesarthrocarpum]
MDVIGNLVGSQGCAPDGTTNVRNPLSKLVDTLMEGSAGTQQKGRGTSHLPPGAGAYGPGQAAHVEGLRRHMEEGMDMGRGMNLGADMEHGGMMRPMGPMGPRFQPGPLPPQQRGPDHHMPAPPANWAGEFQQLPPQPGAYAHPNDFEGAWAGAAPMGNAWVNEFQGQGPGPGFRPRMQQLSPDMEAAWSAQMRAEAEGAHMWGAPPRPGAWATEFGVGHHPQPHLEPQASNGIGDPRGKKDGGEQGDEQGQGQRKREGKREEEGQAEGVDGAEAEGDHAASDDATTQGPGSFSDVWAGLDSGIGAREEPARVGDANTSSTVENTMENIWGKSGDDHIASGLQERMETAWQEAQSSQDPDLQAVWEEGDNTLEGVWSRTAARLEAGEGTGGAEVAEGPYELSADNPYLEVEDPLAEGVKRFREGDIAGARLCFEAEISKNPDNSEAWLMLGQSYAENDQDKKAIACLERAVERDPYNLDALLALGTSYVNELDSQRALSNLKAWVQHNPKYSGLEIAVDEYSDGTLMDEVMQLMLQAQRWDSSDPDALVVLGVLYNVSHDYDSAVEAFRHALEARPGDHSLWNKIGASLANHNKSQEALPAYQQALDRKPRYARAWLNMGISQANLKQYEKAAASYLKALELNPEATHIWPYLRIVFTCMEPARFDLVQKAGQEDISVFDGEFDEYLGI